MSKDISKTHNINNINELSVNTTDNNFLIKQLDDTIVDQINQSEQIDQADQSDQINQSEQIDQSDQSDQSEQINQSDQSDQSEQINQSDQSDQSDQIDINNCESDSDSDSDIVVMSNYTGKYFTHEKVKIDPKKQTWKKKDSLYCNNCGKYGHTYKRCYEPITSYGIICLNLQHQNISGSNKKIHDFFVSKYKFPDNAQMLKNICINKYIQKNISCNNRKDLDLYETKVSKSIEYLIVRRRQTYNYIHLIRGLYDIDLENIIKSINLLTKEEYTKLVTNDFDTLWKDIWDLTETPYAKLNSHKPEFMHDYIKGKEQFTFLRKFILPQIQHKINVKYNVPEWGFPKGKRNNTETNIECAIREFEEETGLVETDYVILDRLFPLVENIRGSNGINYKHVYYIAILNDNLDLSKIKLNNNLDQKFEIGDIGLYNMEDTTNKMRSYNTERKDIINTLKLFFTYNTRYFDRFYHEKV
jgi:8-oxo-dGTP pyrophosphatase MutT (NUDIX family)